MRIAKKAIPTIICLAILAFVATSCGESPDVGSAVGNLAPEFDLERIDGGQLKLSELRGQAVLIDFWDTWCPPCREAMPHLQALSVQYEDELEVVGVAIGRDGKAAVAKFVQDRGLTFPVVLIDQQYQTAQDFGGIQSIPTTILVDGDGIIRHVWVGGQTKHAYEQVIRQVLGT